MPIANEHDNGWQRLLSGLDPSPQLAATRYLDLRARLVASFRRRQLSAAEELADEAIDRTVVRLGAGAPIESIEGFAFGVARRLALEHRRAGYRTQTLDHEPADPAAGDPASPWLDSLDHVLSELPAATRELVLLYHRDGEAGRTHRQTIATELGTGLNALRIRMHRLRCELRASIERRVNDAA